MTEEPSTRTDENESAQSCWWDRGRRRQQLTADDRSVSEVLGYVIIFGLVITSIGFVVAGGIPALEDVRETERAANAQRAFDVVADNMAAIYERNNPSRATEIDLGDSEIYYASNVTIAVTVDDGTPVTHEYEFKPVKLDVNDDTSLVYAAGAVFRNQTDGGLMLREPPFLFTETRVHTPIIQTTAPELASASGTTILLRGKSAKRQVLTADTSGSYDTVTIEITSPRYELWHDYFEEISVLSCTVDDATTSVSCDLDDPEITYVTRQQIVLSIIR